MEAATPLSHGVRIEFRGYNFVATNGLAAHHVPVWLPYTKIVISSILALYGLYLLRGEWQRRGEKAVSLAG
jgi:hypothetical protein